MQSHGPDHPPTLEEDRTLTPGVRRLLLETLLEMVLLPGRVVWAALTAGRQRRKMADLILGPQRGSVPPGNEDAPAAESTHVDRHSHPAR